MRKNKPEMFNDVEDDAIRNNNRAAIMANVFEDNILRGKRTTSSSGAIQVLGYFAAVPKIDKRLVYERYKQIMCQRGFELQGAV